MTGNEIEINGQHDDYDNMHLQDNAPVKRIVLIAAK
jgi:hypothetical protein